MPLQIMVDKENEMQRPVACKLNFAAEQKGGAPSKGLGAKRSEGKTLGVLTPSKANNVGRKRGMSMLHVAKPDLEGAKAEQKEIAKKARHSMFPEGKSHGVMRAPVDEKAAAPRHSEGVDPKVRMSISEGKFLDETRRGGGAASSEHGLQRWVAFVLADTESTLASAHTAYTKLAQQRLDAKARAQVKEVLQRDEVRAAFGRLGEEIGSGKLQVREDRNVATDVGLRDHVLHLALSFSAIYLRPALEALFGKMIPRTHDKDSVNLFRFMMAHLTKNADLTAKYNVSGAQSTLSTNPMYFAELNKVMMNNFLRLVVLLEATKQNGVLDSAPPLFRREATLHTPAGAMQAKMYKSTRDVIVAFTSDLLSGEGDVLKHLSQLGCSFLHNQSAIDEYNFQVGNVVADLKDGVVVSRLVEILFSQAQPLMDKMRVPAVSRL
mmetsp:Transcript_11907/g.28909  ORF Transcript_11907/g.28909 Transcript_11907/m.28909 type:complete len:436 (+) Transcript_11907:143-1450(+)